MNLRPHQQEAVSKIRRTFIMGAKSFLLADEVGLGKTRVACELAKHFGKVLIVSPLSTISGWLSEAREVDLNLKQATQQRWPDSDHVIVNYDRLGKFPDNIVKHSGKTIFPYTFDLIIWDESQKLKGYKTQRHKIWEALNRAAGKCLYMSATPAQNPLEMKYLCDVIGVPISNYWGWVKSFNGITQPRWGGFSWRPGYRNDKEKLNGILNGTKSMRRTPQDIAGWPELNRIIHPIQLDPTEKKHYGEAFKEYKERIEASGRSINPKAEQLVAIGKFKQRISDVKLKHTLAKIKDLIEDGIVVTVSVQYRASANWLYEHLLDYRVACITGETPEQQRTEILAGSKSDMLDVIIFTISEGINLHQVEDSHRIRIQINHDIRWSGMDSHQIEGRTNRAGRYAPVYWMVCQDTIDERVAKVLKGKMDSMEGMLESVEITPEQIAVDNF